MLDHEVVHVGVARASVRFATPSLRYVLERWNFTVCSVTHSSRAIRWLV